MGHDDDYDYDRLHDDHQNPEDDGSFDTPKDKFLGVWLVTMCLGATTLMPFNVIITAVDFFSSLYGNSFSFIINFSINLPVIFVMMLLLKFGDRFSLRMRIIWPLFGDCIVLTLIPIIAICFPVSVSYPLVIIASMFAGVFSGILTGSVCGYSAIIGSKYLNATMTGIGIGALGVGILRIITKASLSFAANGNTISCVIYFMLSVVFCWASAVMFFWMERQPFTRLHFERPHIKDSRSEDAPLIDSDEYNFDSMSEMPVESSKSQMMTVIKQTKIEALMVFLVFSVTLSLFPGITSIITSTMIDNGWFQVIMVFLFQVFDFIGRFGSGFFTLPKIVVRVGVVARLVYVPLFLLAVLTSWFHDDSISYFLMITFALSNGIFGTLTMMQAPSQVDDSLRELCGTYMSFVLQLGVIAGATMGIFFGAGTEVLFKHLHPYGD